MKLQKSGLSGFLGFELGFIEFRALGLRLGLGLGATQGLGVGV